jgi:hypothetical protein
MLRFLEGVFLANVGAADAVQEHVHLADGPGAAVEFLPGEFIIYNEATGERVFVAAGDKSNSVGMEVRSV